MEMIKRLYTQRLQGVRPPRWRIILDRKIHPVSGDVIGKHIGDLIEDSSDSFKCLFLINTKEVKTETHPTHVEAIKAFCGFATALEKAGMIVNPEN